MAGAGEVPMLEGGAGADQLCKPIKEETVSCGARTLRIVLKGVPRFDLCFAFEGVEESGERAIL